MTSVQPGMKTEFTIRVTGFAASTLDGVWEMAEEAEDMGDEDAPIFRAVATAYKGGALRFNREEADMIRHGLCELSNSEDGYAEERNHQLHDPEGVRMARAACQGLVGLSRRIGEALRKAPAPVLVARGRVA